MLKSFLMDETGAELAEYAVGSGPPSRHRPGCLQDAGHMR